MKRFPRWGISLEEAKKSIRSREPNRGLIKTLTGMNYEPLDDGSGMFEGNARGWLESGIPAFDWILGGGAPFGRVIEIFGWESVGKTSIAMAYAVACQRLGGVVCLYDTEQAASPARFRVLGLDTTELMYKKVINESMTIESVYDSLKKTMEMVRDNYDDIPLVLIWDTIAATPTKKELVDGVGSSPMGEHARLHSQGLRSLTNLIASTNTVVFYINQLLMKFGMGPFAGGSDSPGGKAVKFYSSIRLGVKKKGFHKGEDGSPNGVILSTEAVKNKVAPPFREALIDLFWDERGFEVAQSTLSWFKAIGVFVKAGPYTQGTLLSGEKLSFLDKTWSRIFQERHLEIMELARSYYHA